MLPLPYQHYFQEFKQQLEHLEVSVRSASDAPKLKEELLNLQRFFQNKILEINTDELSEEVGHRVQSIQVEIDKQLRLLGMDLMFLQAARQAETAGQRRSQAGERVSLLMRYCDALLGEG